MLLGELERGNRNRNRNNKKKNVPHWPCGTVLARLNTSNPYVPTGWTPFWNGLGPRTDIYTCVLVATGSCNTVWYYPSRPGPDSSLL